MYKSLLAAALLASVAVPPTREDYITRAKKKDPQFSKRNLAGVPRVNKSDRKRNKANRWG